MLVWRLARVDTAATWWTAALAGLYPVRWTGMDYTIRKSRRARRVWLHLNEAGVLVVVVPQGFDVRKVEGIVESHREWIARAGSRMSLQRLETGRTKVAALPSRVVLPAIDREWTVHYRMTDSSRVRASESSPGALTVSGAVSDVDLCRHALMRWLRRIAQGSLITWLLDLATEKGFSVKGVSVRAQRTRWASCSRSGTITLNVRLLFVSPELVRHIMLHELCHTVHMDHSRRFWALLEQHDPDWRGSRARLRAEWNGSPAWLTGQVVFPEQIDN